MLDAAGVSDPVDAVVDPIEVAVEESPVRLAVVDEAVSAVVVARLEDPGVEDPVAEVLVAEVLVVEADAVVDNADSTSASSPGADALAHTGSPRWTSSACGTGPQAASTTASHGRRNRPEEVMTHIASGP